MSKAIRVKFDMHLVVEVDVHGEISEMYPPGIKTPEDVARFEKEQYETGYLSLIEIAEMAEPTTEELIVTAEEVEDDDS